MKRYLIYLRSSEWWNSNVPFLLSFVYLGIAYLSVPKGQLPLLLAVFFSWVLGTAAFGYFLNEWTDEEEDLRAGKPNSTRNLSTSKKWGLIAILLSFSMLPFLILKMYTVLFLVVLQLLCFVLYSVKPIRLKRKLYWALLLDSCYAYLFPGAISLFLVYSFQLTSDAYSSFFLISFFSWLFLLGLRNILQHHSRDRHKDLLSGNSNIFISISKKRAVAFIQLISGFELLAVIFWITSFRADSWYYLVALAIYLLDSLLYLTKRYQLKTRFFLKWNVGASSFNFFYEQRLPLLVLLYLMHLNPLYLALLIFHVWLFKTDVKRLWYFLTFIYYHTFVLFYHHVFLKYGYHYGHKIKKYLGLAK